MPLQRRIFRSEGYSFDHFYLCNYKPKSSGGHDKLSQSLLRFKDGREPDVRAWIECSVHELKTIFTNSGACVVHALGHNELIATEFNRLGALVERLVIESGLTDARKALCKRRIGSKLATLSKYERVKETSDNYSITKSLIPSNRILIVDDILTTGSTMTAIISALKNSLVAPSIKLFTLAFCEYVSELNDSITLRGSHYNWQTKGMWKLAEMPEDYVENFEELCERIRKDDFS